MAILAGDALFPLGFRHIVSHTPSHLVPEGQLIRVIAEIARSVGSTGMAAGQFLDLEGAPNSVDFVQRKKFGEMAECSAVCGGFLGGAADDDILRLRRYGRAVGMLYQVVDDVLKAKTKSEEDEEKKKKGKSYVDVYGMEKAMERNTYPPETSIGIEIERSGEREWRIAKPPEGSGAVAGGTAGNDHDEARRLLDSLPSVHVHYHPLMRFSNLPLPPQFPSPRESNLFQTLDVALSINLLRPLLPPNPYLRSLKVDCSKLDDSSIEHLVRPSLHEISLLNCADFSGRLLSLIGGQCKDLRSLYLGCVAEKRGRAVHISNLEELLCGCTELKLLTFVNAINSLNWLLSSCWRRFSNVDVRCSSLRSEQNSSCWRRFSNVDVRCSSLRSEQNRLKINYDPYKSTSVDRSSEFRRSISTYLTTPPMHVLQPFKEFKHLLEEWASIKVLPCLGMGGHQSIRHVHSSICSWAYFVICAHPALILENLTSLEIGYVSSVMVTELLSPNVGPHQPPNHLQPSILPSLQRLCLSVDYITDTMVETVSKCLINLTHLDLRDAPIIEPRVTFDLTNSGFQQINQRGKLKHLSLVRSQEFLITYFKRVNDLGILLMADRCSSMETTSLSLTHVSLRWCNLLRNQAVISLASNLDLRVLDLRDCRNLGDEALQAISTLHKLKILLLDGSDITDAGLSYLREGVIGSLVSLSIRGCKRLTDKCISALFDPSSKQELQELDLSNLPNLSDNGIFSLAKSRVPILELRMRQCPLIGDTSIMALASMQNPYFPRLRWLGVTGSVNRDMVDALARSRPFLHVACHGEELGTDHWDGLYMHDNEEMDELEQWLLEGGDESDDEEMEEVENNGEMVEFAGPSGPGTAAPPSGIFLPEKAPQLKLPSDLATETCILRKRCLSAI
ncbi:F-box/LRR-repeat protein 10 [Vitis vinifera]|uniref:F-box/LRR-repeat protein 10 n=1 Tax=Vitis vinifera TaxID=29760 RepID=A0A438DSP7_VITVI|nr:F-box/LRR-repeat protein 10 [Vitis vinifera]